MLAAMPSMTPVQYALFLGVLIIPIIPNLWALWHIFRRDFPSSNEKMGWAILNIMAPVVGGLIYVIWGRKRGK